MKGKIKLKIGVLTLIVVFALSILAVSGAFTLDDNSSHKMFSKHNKSFSNDCYQYKSGFNHSKKWVNGEFREKIIQKLGLSEDATEEEIREAIHDLKKTKFSKHSEV